MEMEAEREVAVASRKDLIESELLLLRYRRGEPRAFEELVSMWEKPLYYYIRRLVDSEEDAWDSLQDVWCRVVRSLHTLRDPGALPAWLYKIARHAAISHWRRNPQHEPLPEGDDEQALAGEEHEISIAGYEARDIHQAMGRLSLAHREALTLHFLEGFSLAEIGAITGAPVGTVKSRLHHAKAALRQALEGKGDRHA